MGEGTVISTELTDRRKLSSTRINLNKIYDEYYPMGILRHLVRKKSIDISEEGTASIFRVE
jgi:hypothetical protein